MIKKILLGVLAMFVFVVSIGVGVVKYHQYQNLQVLFDAQLDGRLIAHKVNQQDKLEAVLGNGIRSFELDVQFRKQGESGYFEIGDDDHEAKGQTFESYLEFIQDDPIKKIWMVVKNIDDENAASMLEHLERFHRKYAVKPLILLESTTTSEQFKIFRKAVFHTSYYLPTGVVLKLLAQQNPAILKLRSHAG